MTDFLLTNFPLINFPLPLVGWRNWKKVKAMGRENNTFITTKKKTKKKKKKKEDEREGNKIQKNQVMHNTVAYPAHPAAVPCPSWPAPLVYIWSITFCAMEYSFDQFASFVLAMPLPASCAHPHWQSMEKLKVLGFQVGTTQQQPEHLCYQHNSHTECKQHYTSCQEEN